LNKILNRPDLPGVRSLRILATPTRSIREGVDQITRLAKRWKADLVVTTTRAHKGIRRWVMGSFAETLLLYSDVPILFINPYWKRTSPFNHILFCTDFSEESREAFKQVLKFAKSIGSKITVFNKLESGRALFLEPAFIGYVPSYEMFSEEREVIEQEASEWAAEAQSQGVTASSYVDLNPATSKVGSIVSLAKKKPGIIAIASHSGPMKTIFLGSLTREVVRSSPYPVWVLHPKLQDRLQDQDIEQEWPLKKGA
jgi:nucleotide-binding universal stress UspA family protein